MFVTYITQAPEHPFYVPFEADLLFDDFFIKLAEVVNYAGRAGGR
jgi:hypothetical protein